MKLQSYIAVIILLGSFILGACNSKTMQQENTSKTQEGQLEWTGEYMVDGCGFVLKIDGQDYKPEDENAIGEEFKIEGEPIPVRVTYTLTGETIDRRCGLATQSRAMPGIRIQTIERL